MPKVRSTFHWLDIESSEDWFDTTDDLPPGAPPTLSKADGVGALQFTIARFVGGKLPGIEMAHLRAMFDDFMIRRGFAAPEQVTEKVVVGNSLVYGDFGEEIDDDPLFIRVWYVSNGRDAALVTYTTGEDDDYRTELAEAQAIVESIRFLPTGAAA
jgi:hypothetical protein